MQNAVDWSFRQPRRHRNPWERIVLWVLKLLMMPILLLQSNWPSSYYDMMVMVMVVMVVRHTRNLWPLWGSELIHWQTGSKLMVMSMMRKHLPLSLHVLPLSVRPPTGSDRRNHLLLRLIHSCRCCSIRICVGDPRQFGFDSGLNFAPAFLAKLSKRWSRESYSVSVRLRLNGATSAVAVGVGAARAIRRGVYKFLSLVYQCLQSRR